MSTNAGATESNSDAVDSSEPPTNSDIAGSNGDTVTVGAESLDSKTETLTTQPSSGGIVQESVVDARVSGDETGVVMDKDEELLDESSSDAVVASEQPSNGDVAVGEEVMVVDGTDSLDLKTETLTTGPSSGGTTVPDLVDDARVCGGEIGVVMEKNEKLLDESSLDAVSEGVMVVVGAESLDSKTETQAAQPSSGGIVVQELVDNAKASGGETGVVMDKDEKLLDESSSDAVVSNVPPAASYGVKIGAETLITETSDNDGGGDVVKDLVNEARVSGDETEVVMDNNEKVLDGSSSDAAVSSVKTGADLLESKYETLVMESSGHDGGDDIIVQDLVNEARVSGDETGVVMDNNEKVLDGSSSDAAVSSVKAGADLFESKSETLVMESSGNDGGGDIIVQDLVNEGRVSGDETGIVTENSEIVLDKPVSDTVNGIKIGAGSLGSETENLAMKPSADQNEGGDIAIHDSIDDSRVSGDEKGTVMENTEKVSDEKEVNNEEKEGEYKVADIIWAKVKNYPWWPGQIFDPSSSTDKAKKYSNKKGFFVGYFGDQSFAWNKASNIKPFRKNFCKLEKQSNSKAFSHAVDCALDEVSRRVDFGLACSCLSKEVYDKIKTQVFVNSGIREEASKIDGGDRFSTVSTFKPVKVVQSVQELAREHFDGFSRLEVLSIRTQLLAFFRWKGYYQFQAQDLLDGPDNKLEDESELPLTEENKVVEDEKPASVGKNVSSKKRKPDVCDSDDSGPRKKERSVTKGNSSVEKSKKSSSKKATVKEGNGNEKTDNSSVKRSKKGISRKATIKDNVVSEESGDEKPDSAGEKVSSKKRKLDVCDSDDSVPRKKERNLTSKGISSVKRSKMGISKKTTVEDNVGNEENENEKPDSVGKKVSSKKRKPEVSDSDDSVPRKKERSSTNMTSKGNSSVKRSKKGISKKATVEGDVVNVENRNGTDSIKPSSPTPKKMFRVGDSICRIAKQISESPPILKKESQKSKNDSPKLRKTAKKD